MIIQIGKKSEKSVKIRGSFRYIELTLISQRATFYQFSSLQFPLRGLGGIRFLSTSGVIGILIFNHLKNNSKILVEIFCQFKKKLYFCTRFRKGSEFIKIDQKNIFKKDFGSFEKRLYLCTRKQSD